MIKTLLGKKWIQILIAMLSTGVMTYLGTNLTDNVSIKEGTKTDTVYVEVPAQIDTAKVLEFVEPGKLEDFYKSTLGQIIFRDTSNLFTNVLISTEFPAGERKIVYKNKYVPKNFRKYIGIGMAGEDISLTGDLYYKKLGLGLTINQGETGFYFKYEF